MATLLVGAIGMACAVIGLVFVRFWKGSRDPFFLYFAASFWIQGAQWVHAALAGPAPSEYSPFYYLPRLLAYALIAFAILRKNYPGRGKAVASGSASAPGDRP
jgi:hypothetical protein